MPETKPQHAFKITLEITVTQASSPADAAEQVFAALSSTLSPSEGFGDVEAVEWEVLDEPAQDALSKWKRDTTWAQGTGERF
jgi:hypothetical protein